MSATVLDHSFACFLYPFRFEGSRFGKLCHALDAAVWAADGTTVTVWESISDPAPPGETLCHIEDFFNSGVGREQPGGPPDSKASKNRRVAGFWKLTEGAERLLGCGGSWDWALQLPRGERVRIRIGDRGRRPGEFSVLTALAHTGIGLVALNARPESQDVAEWMDFNHYFRFAERRRGVSLSAERRVGLDPQTRAPVMNSAFPSPAGGVGTHPDGVGGLIELIRVLLATADEGGNVPWWGHVYAVGHLMSYQAVFLRDVPQGLAEEWSHRICNCFHSSQAIVPDNEVREAEANTMPYARGQSFFATLSGAGFIAFDPPDEEFFQTTLPDHLRRTYFFAVLLATMQRFSLVLLSRRIAETWQMSGERGRNRRMKDLSGAMESLHTLTAMLYFSHVFQSWNHQRFYKLLHTAFGVPELFAEVTAETNEMHQALLSRKADRLQRLLGFLSIAVVVPAMALAVLGINWRGFTTTSDGIDLSNILHLRLLGGAGMAMIVGILIVYWWVHRASE